MDEALVLGSCAEELVLSLQNGTKNDEHVPFKLFLLGGITFFVYVKIQAVVRVYAIRFIS
jgi:hypothetical protein